MNYPFVCFVYIFLGSSLFFSRTFGQTCDDSDLSVSDVMNITGPYVPNVCLYEDPEVCDGEYTFIDDKYYECTVLSSDDNPTEKTCGCNDGDIRTDVVMLVDSLHSNDNQWSRYISYLPQYYYDNIVSSYNRHQLGDIDIQWLFFGESVEFEFGGDRFKDPSRWQEKYADFTFNTYPNVYKTAASNAEPNVCDAFHTAINKLKRGNNPSKIIVYHAFNSINESHFDTCNDMPDISEFDDLKILTIRYSHKKDVSAVENHFNFEYDNCLTIKSQISDSQSRGKTAVKETTAVMSDFICMYASHVNDEEPSSTAEPILIKSKSQLQHWNRDGWTRDGVRFHEKRKRRQKGYWWVRDPTHYPTDSPTAAPFHLWWTQAPTDQPTDSPTRAPTNAPTDSPTNAPTDSPTRAPTDSPTDAPTRAPTHAPTDAPTRSPSDAPTDAPTRTPSAAPTDAPSLVLYLII